ncbi:MAG: Ferrochelatase [Marinobacterium sp. xm-d-530]|nr:MAG: Ferrochelatase [Marinobacterium sp. xm-d-530]
MKYKGFPKFSHSQKDKIGILVTNLGTPDAPTPKALKRYLKEFLWDPRVVEVPRPIWWMVLNFIILNIRPKRSAEAYSTVWTDEGSPLLTHTKNQAEAIRNHFESLYGDRVVVDFAMRYGNPSIESVLDSMQEAGVRKLVVLPLYPQYSASTTASTFDAVASDFQKRRLIPDFRFIQQYADEPAYIEAVADKIDAHWAEHGRADKLIFSYHGVPKRYLLNGDPYHCQCHKTTRLIANRLGLKEGEYMTCFQSRFGREEWLKPYTDETLKSLPSQGVKSVQVVCPGFSSDCLETIEEIGEENREYFEEAGGERYEYIEALNSDPSHISMLCGLIDREMQGWISKPEDDYQLRSSEAKAKGAEQ